MGRSRGGLTTRLHAAVDAIGLPIRIHPTPGQHADSPQANALLTGLEGVGHVTADDLGAAAQIRTNPRRTSTPVIDRRLYKERHQVECFSNKPKRFRRMALCCEETLPAFMGFVHLASAMIWLR